MHYYAVYWQKSLNDIGDPKNERSFLSFGDAQNYARMLEDEGMINISIYACNRVYESQQRSY